MPHRKRKIVPSYVRNRLCWIVIRRKTRKAIPKQKHTNASFAKQIFTHTYNLQQHITIHIGGKANLCLACQNTFACSSSLKTHTRTHTGEKPFQCEVCKQIFSHSRSLRNHIR